MGVKKIDILPEVNCYEYIFDNNTKKYRFCKHNRIVGNMYCYMHSKKNIYMINNGVTIENIVKSNNEISPSTKKDGEKEEDVILCKKLRRLKIFGDEKIKVIKRIVKFFNNSEFYNFEKGKFSRPDMMRINNNGIKIPLEVKLCYNDFFIIEDDKIEDHLKYNNAHVCIYLIISPITIEKFVKSGNINDVLVMYGFG